MKKLVSAVLVLLALGVAAFFFFKVRRLLPERSRAAELAPSETIFFAQFPNLRQTALRVPKTDLYQIWGEPEVQAFLEKPRRKAPWMRSWTAISDDLVRAAPGEFFVAVTSIDESRPQFVGGFSFAGSERSAETLAAHLREQLFPDGEIVVANRSNWHFFASDTAMLEAMLARFDSKPGASLAADPVFQQCLAPLGGGQDFVLYGKPEALAGRLDALIGLGGSTKSSRTEPFAMATKIDGSKLRDTIFLRSKGPAHAGALSRKTLPLASPQTLLYYVTESAQFQPGSDIMMLRAFLPSLARTEKAMAEKGLTWADLSTAIGPEVGAMFEWSEDAALPTLLLASEIRDPAKMRTFTEILTSPVTMGSAWRTEDHGGITISSAPSQTLSFIRPAVALTDRFALLGLSPETVTGTLPRTLSQGSSLGQTATYQDVAQFVPEQATAFGYLDFRRLFERVYRMTRPFITLSLAFSPEAGAAFDAGKLPPVDAISKHLGASVLTQSRIEGGTVIESVGSLTIPELLLGLGAGATASGLPDLSGVIPGGIPRSSAAKSRKSSFPSTGTGAPAPRATPPSTTPEKTVP